jgi:hypothetical protein
MSLTDIFSQIKYNYFGSKLFRREVEALFYSNKAPNLPKVNPLTADEAEKYKFSYPLGFYKNGDEFNVVSAEMLKYEDGGHILNLAGKVLENKYDILYSGEIYLGEKINWSRDYKSGHEWKTALYWQEDFFDFPKGADLKYPWELARFHQALWLGKAYLATSDEKYTEKFISLLTDFDEANPFGAGVNWMNQKETAIRLINIAAAFSFFMNSPLIDRDVINGLRHSALLYASYLENNLEYSSRRDSRYLAGILGIAVTGFILQNHPYGKRNIGFAFPKFEQEIRHQIYADGVSYEQSVPYHSTILEMFYLAKILYEKNGFRFSEGYNERLKKMFLAQSAYLRKDNSVPIIGDIISSRILAYKGSAEPIDFSYTLPVGAYLFNEPKLRYYSYPNLSELLFLFGPGAVEKYKQVKIESPDFRSIGLSLGGHFILRDFNMHLFIEAGDVGKHGGGAPGHDDTFSFDLFYKDKKIIVDSGTYSYFNDKQLRNKLRSVRHHNTAYIDGENLTEYKGLFKIKEDLTKPEVLEWVSDKNEDRLSVQHHAYLRFTDPVVCRRSFNFIKQKGIIKIKDEFVGGAAHQAACSIHFHPDVTVTKISDMEYHAKREDVELSIRFETESENYYSLIQDTEYSEPYGHLTSAKKIVISISDIFPAFINTEIVLI